MTLPRCAPSPHEKIIYSTPTLCEKHTLFSGATSAPENGAMVTPQIVTIIAPLLDTVVES